MQTNIIMTIRQKKPINLVSYNKKIQIWHKKFKHRSNARIIRALKILIIINKFDTIYNLAKIYNNFKVSKIDNVNAKLESNITI